MEVIWLLGKLRPDFRTISDFRKINRAAFKKLLRQFTLLCRDLDLFSGKLVAIDGTRIKADNAQGRHYTQNGLKRKLARIEAYIESYLEQLDVEDKQEGRIEKDRNGPELTEKIQALKEKQGKYEELLEEVEQSADSQISLTDKDSRSAKKNGVKVIGYALEIAVDEKHKLLAASDVTITPASKHMTIKRPLHR